MQLSPSVRLGLSALGLFFLPVFYLNVEKVAESQGWDVLFLDLLQPTAQESATSPSPFLSAALSTSALMISTAVLALVAGVWLDAILRRIDGRAEKGHQKVGADCVHLATLIETGLRSLRGPDYERCVPAIVGLYETLKKLRITTPAITNENWAIQYRGHVRFLRLMAALLRDGHIKPARRMSRLIRPDPRGGQSAIPELPEQPNSEQEERL
ncbi:MAG: hypothetical protein NTY59_04015 [Alphaproteobacteria bacterium]|nr:hypothetical protein [Alphaproteobacteria bacterium]